MTKHHIITLCFLSTFSPFITSAALSSSSSSTSSTAPAPLSSSSTTTLDDGPRRPMIIPVDNNGSIAHIDISLSPDARSHIINNLRNCQLHNIAINMHGEMAKKATPAALPTPLEYAVQTGDKELLQAISWSIIHHSPDERHTLFTATKNSQSLLDRAVTNHDYDIMTALAAEGTPLTTASAPTPLSYSSAPMNPQIILPFMISFGRLMEASRADLDCSFDSSLRAWIMAQLSDNNVPYKQIQDTATAIHSGAMRYRIAQNCDSVSMSENLDAHRSGIPCIVQQATITNDVPMLALAVAKCKRTGIQESNFRYWDPNKRKFRDDYTLSDYAFQHNRTHIQCLALLRSYGIPLVRCKQEADYLRDLLLGKITIDLNDIKANK